MVVARRAGSHAGHPRERARSQHEPRDQPRLRPFVTSRAHEIGVRMALGARPANVSALVIRGGLVLAVAGIAVGFGLALLSAHLVEPLLFDTSPRDPRVYALVAVTLAAMALLAAALPAARARRINPIEAMREE